MSYTFAPSPAYVYATRRGDGGESVAALQVNLIEWGFSTLVLDGSFRLNTDTAVRTVQKKKGLIVDGIAGPATQRALCLDLMNEGHQRYEIPTGLLRGICQHESGFILAAYAPHPSDAGFDLGPFQDSFPPRQETQENFHAAYDALHMGLETAGSLRTQKDRYDWAPHTSSDQERWELAALYHNWPFAADNLAFHGTIFPSNPEQENEPAQWVIKASAGRLTTPLQWAGDYIAKVCAYVTNWTA